MIIIIPVVTVTMITNDKSSLHPMWFHLGIVIHKKDIKNMGMINI